MTTPHPVSDAARAVFAETQMHAAAGWFFERFLLPPELDAAWTDAVAQPNGQQLFEKLLERLGVRCQCASGDLYRVPSRGPVVAVANHPFGMVEGVILGSLLYRDERATARWNELYARQNTGLLATKASTH